MMRVVLVEPGKCARPVEIKEDLHTMQELVGGSIQALYPWDEPVALVCNVDPHSKIGQVTLRPRPVLPRFSLLPSAADV